MNHREIQPACDHHRDVGFRSDCNNCVSLRSRQEKAIIEHRERQAAKTASLNPHIIHEQGPGPWWVKWLLASIGIGATILGLASWFFSP